MNTHQKINRRIGKMAKQKSSNGIDIELIYVKNGHQACYMHMMTMSNIKPKGNYVWTKKNGSLYYVNLPRNVKHVYRAVSVPAEVESLHLFFEGVERNLPILFK